MDECLFKIFLFFLLIKIKIKIKIPNLITIIKSFTFRNNFLNKVTISDSVIKIANSAFVNNKNLQRVIIKLKKDFNIKNIFGKNIQYVQV